MILFAATLLVNGAADAFARLFPMRLIDVGLPVSPGPIVWLTGLGIAALAVGAVALRAVEARLHGKGAVRRDYALASLAGATGLALLAGAPNVTVGAAAVLLVSGIALPLTRTLATIEVNRLTTDRVRATVHSFLAQVEYLGEITCGATIGVIAHATNLSVALMGGAALFAATAMLILRLRAERSPQPGSVQRWHVKTRAEAPSAKGHHD